MSTMFYVSIAAFAVLLVAIVIADLKMQEGKKKTIVVIVLAVACLLASFTSLIGLADASAQPQPTPVEAVQPVHFIGEAAETEVREDGTVVSHILCEEA